MAPTQSQNSKINAHRTRSSGTREARDTYKYQIKIGGKVVYSGVTNNLAQREKQHKFNAPGSRFEKVGRKTTKSAALKWEAKAGSPSGWDIRKATKQAIGMNRDALKELGRL